MSASQAHLADNLARIQALQVGKNGSTSQEDATSELERGAI